MDLAAVVTTQTLGNVVILLPVRAVILLVNPLQQPPNCLDAFELREVIATTSADHQTDQIEGNQGHEIQDEPRSPCSPFFDLTRSKGAFAMIGCRNNILESPAQTAPEAHWRSVHALPRPQYKPFQLFQTASFQEGPVDMLLGTGEGLSFCRSAARHKPLLSQNRVDAQRERLASVSLLHHWRFCVVFGLETALDRHDLL